MNSLISPDDYWMLWAVIIAGTGSSIWLEQVSTWAARLTAPVLALGLAMLLSNLGVMPTESPAYDFVGSYLVPLAIPLLLFRASAVEIFRTGRVFVIFHLSAIGSVVGAVLATGLLSGHVPHAEHAAGIMTGSYVGGAINFFALKETYHIDEAVTNPLLVADNFVMASVFVALLAMAGSRFFRRHYPHPHSLEADTDAAGQRAAQHWQRKGIALLDFAQALGVAFVVIALADLLGRLVRAVFVVTPDTFFLLAMLHALVTNRFVLITILSLACSTLLHRPLSRINGPEEIGGYLLYVFLFVIGLPADLMAVLLNVPLFFVFCAIMALTNLSVTLLVGKLFRLPLEELLLCVNATLGGAPSAAAMAVSAGWPRLVLPGILVGIWGYVVGTPIGILVAESLLKM